MKSAVEEIRQRFDEEIDRLAIPKIGQGTPIDLPHCFAWSLRPLWCRFIHKARNNVLQNRVFE